MKNWISVKFQNFCSVKGTLRIMKIQATNWLKKNWQVTFITQKHNLKWATNLNISIIRKDTQMANKHMKSL